MNNVSRQYNLEIMNANFDFGLPSTYEVLKDLNSSSELITYYGEQGRYFFDSWGSFFSYDMASFLFEKEFENIFNGIIISPYNLWLDNKDYGNINKIKTGFIKEARENRIKESILFQLFYEIVIRIKIS